MISRLSSLILEALALALKAWREARVVLLGVDGERSSIARAVSLEMREVRILRLKGWIAGLLDCWIGGCS